MPPNVVLYNPRAPFYTMPLALLAVGSRLDRRRLEVRIVDGRLERDGLGALFAALDHRTLCLGLSVLTGAPIRDALALTRAGRAARPTLPIIWGGWHPSLFPLQSLLEADLDAVVIGQGEETLAALVERLAAGAALEAVAGSIVRPRGARQREGAVLRGAPRPLVDVNRLPAHDYTLIPVERYFAAKRRRQLDYVSSQGCRFRCAFCADPYVYGRNWTGLDPSRVGDEVAALARRYAVEEVAFQDETFFTSPQRVTAIAQELLHRDLRVRWTATLRADQARRLDFEAFLLCRRAGLRRVLIGVEAGSQPTLDWMQKDITVEEVIDAAEKCRRADVAALFNFIVGFPGESPASVRATLQLAKRLRAMSPKFEIALFYYKPYPGNALAALLERSGHRLPQRLEDWAAFDYVATPSPWIAPELAALVEGFKFYQRLAWSRPRRWLAPLQALARWRCAGDRYGFPIERRLAQWLRPTPDLT
jgi:anaerobic magnesium-protoporphyrin IX monomethyl ester cyclase